MSDHKTRSIEKLEEKMEDLDEGSIRFKILESAKSFKTSWVDLGQSLYSVWKDKMYKEWGYTTFDAYTIKEIGIKKETALKLLRSYYFLEKEEPAYLKSELTGEKVEPSAIPSYEAIDTLRLAKNRKDIDQEDYAKVRKYVLEKGKDAKEVKKDLTQIIRQREELEPEEAREKRKTSLIRRFIGSLKAIQTEIRTAKLLPMPVIKEIDSLIEKLESGLE